MSECYDFCVVGGGFYGCCLALWLRAHSDRILLLEKEDSLMSRASAINQARVHTGFHYPRSLTTAIRSLVNMPRFVFEFRRAIVDDFTMLYAIARKGSKVNSKRFWRMYKEMKAPIEPASPHQKAYFNSDCFEDVFAVREYAFNHDILRSILESRIEATGIEVRYGVDALSCRKKGEESVVTTTGGDIRAGHVLNCTYSRINRFLEASGEPLLNLKHEITELVLVEPPENMKGVAVTIMDGPFFSLMPYPSCNAYSLSHVRYTPHAFWRDSQPCVDAHEVLKNHMPETAYPLMLRDIRRYMHGISLQYRSSIFEVKTVLARNETDDGRPILYKHHAALGSVYTVMGSKIDNIYDLFEAMHDITKDVSPDKGAWKTMLGLK